LGAPLEPLQCGWTILAKLYGKVKGFFQEFPAFCPVFTAKKRREQSPRPTLFLTDNSGALKIDVQR